MNLNEIISFLLCYISIVICVPQTVQFEHVDETVRLPYIGGAKGQVLEIRQRPDGSIFSRILTEPDQNELKKEKSEPEDSLKSEKMSELSFKDSLALIQKSAAELVALQQVFKESGKLTEAQKQRYAENLAKLGVSAQKLSLVQDDDNYRTLLEEPQGDRTTKIGKKKPDNIKFPPFVKKPTTTAASSSKKEECGDEETILEEGDTTESTSVSSATTSTTTEKPVVASSSNGVVAISSSHNEDEDNSSVSEAKPVGLAIAGEGGVASSKPIATAVVGKGGVAVARPVATAIAGLKPSDISDLGLTLPTKLKHLSTRNDEFPVKGKFGLLNLSDGDNDEQILVGPDYNPQARLTENTFETDNKRPETDDVYTSNSESSTQTDSESEKEITDDREIYAVENPLNPYGVVIGKYPLFPLSYEGALNYLPNPYLPPYNVNYPPPLLNRFLQRKNQNSEFRYPQAFPNYANSYRRYNNFNGNPYNFPLFNRYFFV